MALNLRPDAGAGSLNMVDNVIYTVTSSCNGAQPAAWAIDLNVDPPKATSLPLLEAGGSAIGTDGTIYVQGAISGQSPGTWELQALSPRELKVQQKFGSTMRTPRDVSAPSPIVFPYIGRDLIVAGDGGNLYLLDSATLTAPYRTPSMPPISGLASWEDPDGTRWVLASVWGNYGPAPNGSVTAFKVEEQNGKTVLTPAWVSRDMNFPQPPVIANGVVFALSSGEFNRQMNPKNGTHATLYALDAATGKELYSSRNLVTAPAALTGMTVANGRVYFGTTDGTFYTFGMYMEH
jgi:outer membrane protein assembly factor BamB